MKPNHRNNSGEDIFSRNMAFATPHADFDGATLSFPGVWPQGNLPLILALSQESKT